MSVSGAGRRRLGLPHDGADGASSGTGQERVPRRWAAVGWAGMASALIALAFGRVRARQVETLPPAKHARTTQPGERYTNEI